MGWVEAELCVGMMERKFSEVRAVSTKDAILLTIHFCLSQLPGF